jgi:hypothetical protein
MERCGVRIHPFGEGGRAPPEHSAELRADLGKVTVSALHPGEVCVRGPFADFAETPLDLQDLADVAALSLTGDDLVGRKLVLTGPESLTQADMVARIGDVLGHRLAFEEVPAEVARQGMLASGLREPFVDNDPHVYFLALSPANPSFPTEVGSGGRNVTRRTVVGRLGRRPDVRPRLVDPQLPSLNPAH